MSFITCSQSNKLATASTTSDTTAKTELQNIEVTEKQSVKNDYIAAQDKSSTNLFLYKDDTTGIEYITQEHIQNREISNNFKDLNNIKMYGCYLYDKITEIHPRYLNSIPTEVAKRKDLFALAPEGYLWVEDDRVTSYFHWDEWKSLRQYNYKRGTEFNIYCYH